MITDFYDPLGWVLQLVLCSVALNDFLYERIEHRFLGAILALYALGCFMCFDLPLLSSLYWFLVLLSAGAVFFYLGLWGGGDAKLLPVLSLWIPSHQLWQFVYEVAILGGCMALVWVGLFQNIHPIRLRLAYILRESARESLWIGVILPSALKQWHLRPSVFHFPYGVPLVMATLAHIVRAL